jgi:BMFP domain-containing protein YqiC
LIQAQNHTERQQWGLHVEDLSRKLKYKEVERHILRKNRQDLEQLEKKIRNLEKENKVLKERVGYYIRLQ